MDNSIAKWLVRAGSLLVVLGFFVPSVAVSCSVLPGATQSFSMGQLAAGQANQPLLYLILLGAITALIVAFIPPRNNQQKVLLLMGQILGLGLGVLSILATAISLSGQIKQAGFDIKASAGSFVLLLGYGLGGVGIIMDFLPRGQLSSPRDYYASPPGFVPNSPQMAYPPPQPISAGARLELARGGNSPALVPIAGTDFWIGRSSQCHLRLSDRQISSAHVRIRFAQGNWFIQDQNSSNGTFVNGRKIQAQRLNNGDQIRLGKITYIFRI